MKRRYTKSRDKVEEPPKKRPVGRPPRQAPPKEKQPSVTTDDGTSHKAIRNKPLPVVEDLETTARTAYKSIADSGVLATSLSRSKTRWTLDGLFDKFWSKPSKKKGQADNAANNPPKESMQKAGHCYVTVEPHVFEAVIWSVRNLNPATPATSTPNATPIFQYGPVPAFVPNKSITPSQQPFNQISGIHNTNQNTPSHPNSQPPLTHQSQQSAPQTSQLSNSQDQTAQKSLQATPSTTSTPTLDTKPTSPATSITPSTAPNPPTQQGPDPVIQMLAQRASTNAELKVLMKIVASGSADTEQLRVFQSHIDDLTAILHRQNQQKATNNTLSTPQAGTASSSTPAPQPSNPKGQFGTLAASGPASNYVGTPLYQPINRPTPPSTVVKPKITSAKSDIVGALIEFPGASGDRYSIPKHSILEYLPSGRQVLVSFIITRKGSESESDRYAPSKEYWEPVTMRISTDSPKVLDVLAKAVAPYEDACQWMEDSMKRATRADNVHLAFKLPTSSEGDDDADTSFLTPLEAGRVRLLKSLGPRAAPAGSGEEDKPKKWARNKHEDWDRNCQCCYAPPEDVTSKDEAGRPICGSCEALKRAGASAASKTVRYDNSRPESHGPQALVLSF